MNQPYAQSRRVHVFTWTLLLLLLVPALSGCSRRFWRQQADQDTYRAVAEKMNHPHWMLPRISLQADEHSRFFDPYDPDHHPLPPDDPAAHRYMHCVNGREGYKGWHKYGDTQSVENPFWLEPFTNLMSVPDPSVAHSEVEIPSVTLQDSVELTYIHSREYQFQLEEVYLRALALTGERFILGTRFNLGGPGLGGGLFNSVRQRNGLQRQNLTNGLGLQQTLPSGAQMGVDILNTITWNMGDHTGTATSLAWGITQPLLNQAGRKVVLENLTQSERELLYQVRDMARFRQVLFTDVATDYLELQLLAQNIINRENNIRQLTQQIEAGKVIDSWPINTVGEDLETLPDGFQIPPSLLNKLGFEEGRLTWTGTMSEEEQAALLAASEDEAYQAAAQQLIRWRQSQTVSLSVLQLVTRLNNAQNQLEGSRRQLADSLDSFKIRLGLPPNVSMTVDDRFLAPFELIDSDLLLVADELQEFQKELGPSLIPAPRGAGAERRQPPEYDDLRKYVTGLAELRDQVREVGLELVKNDFGPVRDVLQNTTAENLINESGRDFGSAEERERVLRDVSRDLNLYRISETDFRRWSRTINLFQSLLQAESEEAMFRQLDASNDGLLDADELPNGWSDLPRIAVSKDAAAIERGQFVGAIRDAATAIREDLLKIAQSLQVVQAGLRVEAIALNRFTLPGRSDTPDIEEVVRLGLENRHDLMNAKAAVMDARRLVEVRANALKAVLDLSVDGTINSQGGVNDDVRVSLDFKTPIDNVLQRNAYRAAQIAYQRERRAYMALEDRVKQQIRGSWRQLQVSEQRLEIDRQTVRNAALQYDNVATGAGQNNSLSLLNALDSVLNAQNALVGDWVTYETNRLNIYRDMGIMEIDPTGIWQDDFYRTLVPPNSDTLPAANELTPELQSNASPTELSSPPPATGPAAADLPVLEIPENE